MANKKFTDLPTLTTAATDDILPVVDTSANVSKQTTVAGLAGAVAASLPNSTVASDSLVAVKSEKLSATLAFRAYRSGDQTNLTNGAFIKIQLNAESYDDNANFDATTNYRYVAPISGKYQFNWGVQSSDADEIQTDLYVNGTIASKGAYLARTNFIGSTGADTVKLVAGDYVELYCYTKNGGASSTAVGTSDSTFLSGHYVGV